MTLSFLALEVIPHLKLTDQGLVDVDKFEFVHCGWIRVVRPYLDNITHLLICAAVHLRSKYGILTAAYIVFPNSVSLSVSTQLVIL